MNHHQLQSHSEMMDFHLNLLESYFSLQQNLIHSIFDVLTNSIIHHYTIKEKRDETTVLQVLQKFHHSCLSGWLGLIDVEIWFEISCIVLTFWIGCWKEEVEGNWYVNLSDNTFSYRWELKEEETACCCNSFSNPIYK